MIVEGVLLSVKESVAEWSGDDWEEVSIGDSDPTSADGSDEASGYSVPVATSSEFCSWLAFDDGLSVTE
jgi:hypothetical protein